MKKWMVLAGIGIGAACVAAIARKRQSGGERPDKWDKMREAMEQMPADFPPRMMFENVETTRANTDRILELLEKHDREAA